MAFDYEAPAGLFTRTRQGFRGGSKRYQRFATAAEAVRHAVEDIPAPLQNGLVLEVGDEDFDHLAIRALYDSPECPRPRAP